MFEKTILGCGVEDLVTVTATDIRATRLRRLDDDQAPSRATQGCRPCPRIAAEGLRDVRSPGRHLTFNS
jgi:hypothetical protein